MRAVAHLVRETFIQVVLSRVCEDVILRSGTALLRRSADDDRVPFRSALATAMTGVPQADLEMRQRSPPLRVEDGFHAVSSASDEGLTRPHPTM